MMAVITMVDDNAGIENAVPASIWNAFFARYAGYSDQTAYARRALAIACISDSRNFSAAQSGKAFLLSDVTDIDSRFTRGTYRPEGYNGPEFFDWRADNAGTWQNSSGGFAADPFDPSFRTFCITQGFWWEDPGTPLAPNDANRAAVLARADRFKTDILGRCTNAATEYAPILDSDHYYRSTLYELRCGRLSSGICTEWDWERAHVQGIIQAGFTGVSQLLQAAPDIGFNIGDTVYFSAAKVYRTISYVTNQQVANGVSPTTSATHTLADASGVNVGDVLYIYGIGHTVFGKVGNDVTFTGAPFTVYNGDRFLGRRLVLTSSVTSTTGETIVQGYGAPKGSRGALVRQMNKDLAGYGYRERFHYEYTSRAFEWVTWDLQTEGCTLILWSLDRPTPVHADNGFYAFAKANAPNYKLNHDGFPWLSDETDCRDAIVSISREGRILSGVAQTTVGFW